MHQMKVMALRASFAFEFLGHVADNLIFFRVHSHNAAVFRHFFKDAPQWTVGHPNGVESGEDLEACYPFLNRLADLADRFWGNVTSQNIMKGIVSVTMSVEGGTSLLHVVHNRSRENAAVRVQTEVAGEIDNSRHAAERRRAARRLGRLCHHVRNPRPLLRHGNADMCVRLDTAGNDNLPARVNFAAGAGRQRTRIAHSDNLFPLNAHVHFADRLWSNDLSPSDNKIEHGAPPFLPG